MTKVYILTFFLIYFKRLIDDFLANVLGAMMNASYLISIAYFGFKE